MYRHGIACALWQAARRLLTARRGMLTARMALAAGVILAQPNMPAHADDDEVDVVGWRQPSNTFSNQPQQAISATAPIDARYGARVTITVSCYTDTAEFSVGIANNRFDLEERFHSSGGNMILGTGPTRVGVTYVAIVDQKVDGYEPTRIEVNATNDRQLKFTSYKINVFLNGGTYFRLGVPVNGGQQVLRISLRDATFRGFLSGCLKPALVVPSPQDQREGQAKLAKGDGGWNRLNTWCASHPNPLCLTYASRDMITGYDDALSQNVIPAGRIPEVRSRVAQACKILNETLRSSWGAQMKPDELQVCQKY